jgi:hypothetical protein
MAPGDRGITTNSEFLKSFPDLEERTKIDRTARRDLPDGQITEFPVKARSQKYSDFQNTQISL